MHRFNRKLGSMLLTVAFAAPLSFGVMGATQDRQDEKREEKKEQKARERYYDKHHKDYHDWDDSEDRSFHLYLTETHHPIIEFRLMKDRDQQRYWAWRHNHPDHDNR